MLKIIEGKSLNFKENDKLAQLNATYRKKIHNLQKKVARQEKRLKHTEETLIEAENKSKEFEKHDKDNQNVLPNLRKRIVDTKKR